jgi:hypothetical protein
VVVAVAVVVSLVMVLEAVVLAAYYKDLLH